MEKEVHQLADKRFRAISPYHGIFYTDSFTLIDIATNKKLTSGVDYVFAELHQDLTRHTGQEIAGIAIVINRSVSENVKISYQCVGGPYSVNADTIVSLLNKKPDERISYSWWDIINKPSAFTPTAHKHNLGEVANLDVLLYGLERLRNAVFWSINVSIGSLIQLVRDTIDNHIAYIVNKASNNYVSMLIELRNSITINSLGLYNVANYKTATDNEILELEPIGFCKISCVSIYAEKRDRNLGKYIPLIKEKYLPNPDLEEKYITSRGISIVKEWLYSELVTKSDTAIGLLYGKELEPYYDMKTGEASWLKALANLAQGGTFVLESINTNEKKYEDLDKTIYPNTANKNTSYAITKITELPNGGGSVLLATNLDTGEIWSGRLTVSENSNIITLSWDTFIGEKEINESNLKYLDHIFTTNNPHKDKKTDVELDKVENLPVATKTDIVTKSGARKYITYDGLLLFAKAFLAGLEDETSFEEDPPNPSVWEDYDFIFAPCGPCGDLKEIPTLVCPQADQLLLIYCSDDGHRTALYTDGNCGTYKKVIEADAAQCNKHNIVPMTLGWRTKYKKINGVPKPPCTITCQYIDVELIPTILTSKLYPYSITESFTSQDFNIHISPNYTTAEPFTYNNFRINSASSSGFIYSSKDFGIECFTYKNFKVNEGSATSYIYSDKDFGLECFTYKDFKVNNAEITNKLISYNHVIPDNFTYKQMIVMSGEIVNENNE